MDMAYDENLLNRIKQLNAKGAMAAIISSLQDSQQLATLEKFKKSCADLKDNGNEWQQLNEILSSLSEKLCGSIDRLNSIIELCAKQAKQEKNAKIILSSEGFKLWRNYAHLNSKFLRSKLASILKNNSIQSYDLENMQKHYGKGKAGLYKAVDKIVKDTLIQGQAHPLEPWLDFLSFMPERSKFKLNIENADFGRCEFCWRFANGKDGTGQGNFFCHLHQRNSPEYRNIKELEKNAHQLNIFAEWSQKQYSHPWQYLKTNMTNTFFASVRKQWLIDRSNLPENFEELYQDNLLELQAQIKESISYPFELMQNIFPNVVEYVQNAGGNPESPASLLKTLNPDIPESSQAPDQILQKHHALLDIFAKNLALYRPELCEAELIFTAYKQFKELKSKTKNCL